MNRAAISFFIIAAIPVLAINVFAKEATPENAWRYYLQGDYEKAIEVCRVISKYEALGENGRYIMGLSFLMLNQPEEARKNFRFLLENYPASDKKDSALLGIADSYYIENNFEKAEQYYVELLKSIPGTGYASVAHLRLGECQRKLGKWQEANSSFCKIVNDYPFSLEARVAKDFLKDEEDFFSVQVGAFSRKDNAENLAETLKNKGYDAYIEKDYEGDNLVYRVRVGKFNTKEAAEQESSKLKEEGLPARVCS